MATEMVKREQIEKGEVGKINFKCSFCGEYRPISEMKIITRFHPPVTACSDCEKKWD